MESEELLRYKATWHLRTPAFVLDTGMHSTVAQKPPYQSPGLRERSRSEGLKSQQWYFLPHSKWKTSHCLKLGIQICD